MSDSTNPSTPGEPEVRALYGADARARIAEMIAAFPLRQVGTGQTPALTIAEQKEWFGDVLDRGGEGPLNMVMAPDPTGKQEHLFLAPDPTGKHKHLFLAVTGSGDNAAFLAHFFASAPAALRCQGEQLAEAVAILQDLMVSDREGGSDGRAFLSNEQHQRIEEFLGSDRPSRTPEAATDAV